MKASALTVVACASLLIACGESGEGVRGVTPSGHVVVDAADASGTPSAGNPSAEEAEVAKRTFEETRLNGIQVDVGEMRGGERTVAEAMSLITKERPSPVAGEQFDPESPLTGSLHYRHTVHTPGDRQARRLSTGSLNGVPYESWGAWPEAPHPISGLPCKVTQDEIVIRFYEDGSTDVGVSPVLYQNSYMMLQDGSFWLDKIDASGPRVTWTRISPDGKAYVGQERTSRVRRRPRISTPAHEALNLPHLLPDVVASILEEDSRERIELRRDEGGRLLYCSYLKKQEELVNRLEVSGYVAVSGRMVPGAARLEISPVGSPPEDTVVHVWELVP